ncbi:TerD family protein [Streptomyces phytophilus]|uniref:TerD family protein n=1 Tax=Streptomyces phytophilus TaxID=722715 RepID=UPI002867BC4E|nr:TerD family protein [Streptomyces phytophilus]
MTTKVNEDVWSTDPGYAHDWALLDVETSGLRPGQDRVLSVAVATIDPKGRRTGTYETLLDPGCDPGPVHVHGLTHDRLAGAPKFEEVATRLSGLLEGRVLVAHNAQFDYNFLAHEFARARSWLPVSRRLCTLALNRQIAPPTADLRLDTLAAYYGVRQMRPHDAGDDVRVLAGILRGSLVSAAGLGVPLPLVACPPRQEYRPRVPKTPCAFGNPGRLTDGAPLVQGMKIAITGETDISREELIARSVAAGLNVMTSVSRHTSALVTNDRDTSSAKLRRAVAEGVPLLDEHTYVRLLGDVRPGRAPGAAPMPASPEAGALPGPSSPPSPEPLPAVSRSPVLAPPVPPARSAGEAALPSATRTPPGTGGAHKPLAGRRVLVLGGRHDEAAAARVRIVELGASAAVNLSARVTDVLCLRDGRHDRRMERIRSLGLPLHSVDWLAAPDSGPVPDPGLALSRLLGQVPEVVTADAHTQERPALAAVLPRGGVVDLPATVQRAGWSLTASWAQSTPCEVDVVAFAVDGDEQVPGDDQFVFYGAAENPDGTVRLAAEAPSEQAVTMDLVGLRPGIRKIVIAAAIDGAATFGDVGPIEIVTAPGTAAPPVAQATLDAATTERTLLLAEIYRRADAWRFRAVGQGYDHGLAALARSYGVDIED